MRRGNGGRILVVFNAVYPLEIDKHFIWRSDMLKGTSRVGIILCALVLTAALIFSGCNRGGQSSTTTSVSSSGPNLRGSTVQIGHWWGAWDTETVTPRTEDEELQNEFRKKIQSDNGMTIREVEISNWDDMLPNTTTRIMSGNKEISAYYLAPDWAYTLYKQGLLFPLSDSSVDITNNVPIAGQKTAYNAMIAGLFTFGGKQYGLSPGLGGGSWQGAGVYWNKRIFREAGLDPDLPYNLQRDGTWTWDAFVDICRQLTRDINNDGITDVYAGTVDHQQETLMMLVLSNNANFVDRDPVTGRFTNGTNTPGFIEALQFYKRLMDEGYLKPIPPGSPAWDWYATEFHDGLIGFMLDAEWRRGGLGDMVDDFGWVFPPKGPRATQYRMGTSENVLVVPSIFSKDEVDVILTGVDLWNVPITLEWKSGSYPFFRDRRAVDETMTMMQDARYMTFRNNMMIPGLNTGDFAWAIKDIQGDPAQLVEQHAQNWNALIEEANR